MTPTVSPWSTRTVSCGGLTPYLGTGFRLVACDQDSWHAGAGVNIETLRYYERRGLLEAPARLLSGYRAYDDAAVSSTRTRTTTRRSSRTESRSLGTGTVSGRWPAVSHHRRPRRRGRVTRPDDPPARAGRQRLRGRRCRGGASGLRRHLRWRRSSCSGRRHGGRLSGQGASGWRTTPTRSRPWS